MEGQSLNKPHPWLTVNFYLFVELTNLTELRQSLLECCQRHDVLGLVILAFEGINGTLTGKNADVLAVIDFLRSDPRLVKLDHKASYALTSPFRRINVRIKKEIVTMGAPGLLIESCAGTYVAAEEWNRLLQDPDLVLIDSRNDYEVALGSFIGAMNPKISNFRQLPQWIEDYPELHAAKGKKRKIAMFCTGGIRCEKSTAYLRSIGFDQVYHLQGGILNYLQRVDPKESLWQGECFVFDERVSVGHALVAGDQQQCRVCRHSLDHAQRMSVEFEEGVSCPNCFAVTSAAKKNSARERQRQCDLAIARGQTHIGSNRPNAIK